jgi:1-deoxy-D-xylulose-5-phosphate synthase
MGNTLLDIARENPRVVAITAAMSEGTGVCIMAHEFPRRVFDVGICEQHAVTFAAGLATRGFIPVVAIYSTFLQRAFDQVLHDVCIQNLHVIFALDRAGIVGEDGKTHQGNFDLSYLDCIPNMVVCAPKDEDELRHLLYTAIRADCPVAIRYPRGVGLGVTLSPQLHELPLGKGEVLRSGGDVTILALGAMVAPAMEAAQKLSQKGIESTVINTRFAKPLDSQLILNTARMTGRVVTVEENALLGGFGSAVLQLLTSSGANDIQVKCIGLPDVFVEHGAQSLLRSKYHLDTRGIAEEILVSFPELASGSKLSIWG